MISLIIPTYNEAARITHLIEYLEKEKGTVEMEIIVVDGGSADNTVLVAKQTSAIVLKSPRKGRAAQMNYGVEQAKGEVIYFVHADTKPPSQFDNHIDEVINSGKQVGCFTSIFDWNHPFLRFCNIFSRLPFWFCRGGGQTLFIKKNLFQKLGGFNESMTLMEEYDLISRARKSAAFTIIKKNAITSARDYKVNGAFRLQLIYTYVFFLYAIGASQDKMLSVVRKHVVKA